MIEIDSLPQLRDPVLVVSLSGWVDAGLAGGGSVRGAAGADRVACARSRAIDLADLMDLQQTRPTVHLVDGVSREIAWPQITIERRAPRVATSCCHAAPSRRCGGGRCSASSSTSPVGSA